jgi:hypothetical protein
MTSLPAVLASTRRVVDLARSVRIDLDRVEVVADELVSRPTSPVEYDCQRHLCGADPRVANFVLVQDTLNFSFWPEPGEPRWKISDRGQSVDGYWALIAALRRAVDAGVPLLEADYLAQITEAQLAEVLRGEGEIPLLAERVAALREVGQGLRERAAGQFVNLVDRAGRDALRLTSLLAAEFASFADVAEYRGEPVQFYKRAQICCGDLAGASQGAAWGALSNLDQLTAFADYKVPQVLRRLGILVYADALAQLVDQRIPLPPGSEDEVEIRAGTIWGVEELRLALSARGVTIPADQLDWQLWELGQSLPSDTKPYHLTRTVYY